MGKVELVFIPGPALSHFIPAVEITKHLLARHHRLAITLIIIRPLTQENQFDDYISKISSMTHTTTQLKIITLPKDPSLIPAVQSQTSHFDYNDNHIDKIRQIVSNLVNHPSAHDSRLGGLVVDAFCTKFIQVAQEFGVPSYVYYTAAACSLGVGYHLVSLKYEHGQDLTRLRNSETELPIRCFSQPLPAKVLPSVFVEDGPIGNLFLDYARRRFEARGILVNTFNELEPYAIQSLSKNNSLPKVYPIGPILEVDRENSVENDVMNWLDKQPENSVVFLCFGSLGVLDEIQVKEFAKALENCGSKFLWSLRKKAAEMASSFVVEYGSYDDVLPEGFLERTKGVGKVIGWAPQVAVLGHAAVGGFVSHCGWNSILESLWFGVPVAALPMHSEQQVNAFTLVRELGLAEAIKLDYSTDWEGKKAVEEIVPAEEIEAAIRRVMAAGEGGVRGRVKEMQSQSREALEKGGSSHKSQVEFIEDVMRNVGLE